jgi:hypothetical protein
MDGLCHPREMTRKGSIAIIARITLLIAIKAA